jgi:hypothetical protein
MRPAAACSDLLEQRCRESLADRLCNDELSAEIAEPAFAGVIEKQVPLIPDPCS